MFLFLLFNKYIYCIMNETLQFRPLTLTESDNTIPAGSSIAFICDSYDGNKNGGSTTGVKNTLLYTTTELERRKIEPVVIYPGLFPEDRTFKAPCAPEIDLKVIRPSRIFKKLKEKEPAAIFIMTPDGPMGFSASRACNLNKTEFSASYTTNLDDIARRYINSRSHGAIPEDTLDPALGWTYNRFLKKIYRGAHKVMVPTKRMENKLSRAGIDNTAVCARGVDATVFHPLRENETNAYDQYGWGKKKEVLLYFGRISIEKNIGEFLGLHTPGYHKVIIGDGQDRKELEAKYADENTHFLGKMYGDKLAHHVRSARLMIFPSEFDTFGNVLIEAAASGTIPIGRPVQGPIDVISNGINGVLVPKGEPLSSGIEPALKIDRLRCAKVTTRTYNWELATTILLKNLPQIRWSSPAVN